MPVLDVTTDPDTLTLTITAQFAAPVERIWELYSDPRQLERVWGPPSYPATFVEHELVVGSQSTYFMTSPEREKFHGLWTLTEVDEPRSFSFDDAFADENFTANQDLPISTSTYLFESVDDGTRATFTSRFESAKALQQVLDMGVEEGSILAINQIDAFLAS